MYLFKDKNEIDITITCKLCLEEIKFTISLEEYEKIEEFPFKRENTHGKQPHKLIVNIDKNLEVENFKIKQLEKEVVFSKELSIQVLGEIGLTEDEIDLYFETVGRDILSIGEISVLSNKSKEEAIKVTEKFLEIGLFKEIVGVTPHYKALAPYAALVNQLSNFDKFILDIKETVPPELEASFSEIEKKTEGIKKLKEYNEFMVDLKETTLSQLDYQKAFVENTITEIESIRGISNVLAKLKGETQLLMEEQINEISQQFDFINERLAKSMNEQIEGFKNQFGEMDQKISQRLQNQVEGLETHVVKMNANMSKSLDGMHLGAVKTTVTQVVSSITKKWVNEITTDLKRLTREIQRISNDGLEKTTKRLESQVDFNKKVTDQGLKRTTESISTKVIPKMDNSMRTTIDDIDVIVNSSVSTGEEMKSFFGDITDSFSNAVSMAGEKITEISEEVSSSFSQLKELFTGKVINTLNEVLANILQKLETNLTTTNEFWEQAKQVTLFTMKDIWFINSIEAAKAHIIDQIPKAKMRFLIVAPQITDIDVDSLRDCSQHVNIRIVANIDLSIPEHDTVIKEMDKFENITYRHGKGHNLWAANRDSEEVLVCVVSKSEIKGETMIEIAGIGSTMPEHITIFAPILQDVWMSGKKDIGKGKETDEKTQEQKVEKIVGKIEGVTSLSDLFDGLIKDIEEKTGREIFAALNDLREAIYEAMGYTSTMREINTAANPYKSLKEPLKESEKEKLKEKINHWMKKLNL